MFLYILNCVTQTKLKGHRIAKCLQKRFLLFKKVRKRIYYRVRLDVVNVIYFLLVRKEPLFQPTIEHLISRHAKPRFYLDLISR